MLTYCHQTRATRPRAIIDENDENGGSLRVTRAKAAALAGSENQTEAMPKKALHSQKTTSSQVNATANPNPKKRAVLGDKSNVNRQETNEAKAGKKGVLGRTALVPKTTTQNAGIQKVQRTSSTATRSLLATKDSKKASSSDLKRPASGSGVMAGPVKKRNTGSAGSQISVKQDTSAVESEAPKQAPSFNVEVQQNVKAAKVEVVKVEDASEPELRDGDIRQQFDDGVMDLDAEDMDDPLMVAEYVGDIFEYLKEIEVQTMPNPDYMDHQDHLEWHTRSILVDWLVEVHTRFHLLPETLFLAINIIDRFLSSKIVQLDKLQLVGVTAMFIASKYEEVLSPHVTNFKEVTDEQFTDKQILSAERFILASLNYDLSYPNPMNFLRRISKADNYDISTRTLGKYLLEISLVDHRFMEFPPSQIAAAAMYLARTILERGEWVSRIVLIRLSIC